jgi:hypothetical protein
MMSACGVICSECPAYLGATRGPAYRQRTADAWRRIYGLDASPERISCGGCLGPDEQLFHTSRQCKARSCCRLRGLDSCADCVAASCEDLERAQAVWDDVPRLASRLSPADFAAYARPYCGHRARLAAARRARRAGP